MNRYSVGITALGGALALALTGVLHDARPLVLGRLALCGTAPAAGFVLAALAGVLLLVRHGRAAGGRALPLVPLIAAACLLVLLA